MEQLLKPIHLACSDDELRPNFQLIQIIGGIATATNGHILVSVDLKQQDALTPELPTVEPKQEPQLTLF
jgi:hypothetical protein